MRAEAATAASVFDHVALISRHETLDGRDGGNLVLIASDSPLDRGGVEAAIATWGEGATTGILSTPDEVRAFIGESPLLSDDFAPVDQILGR